MKSKKIPFFLLTLLLFNNGLGLINQDNERAEVLKEISQPVSLEDDTFFTEPKVDSEKEAVRVVENMDYESIEIPKLSELENAGTFDKQFFEGLISIPKIDLSINILKGTNHENLKYGATTGLLHQQMGKGNYVLFGHNMEVNQVMFSDLKELKKGDDIFLIGKDKKEYRYQVSSSHIVNKTSIDVIEESNEPIVTLINCSSIDLDGKKVSPNKTPYRLVVVGKLIK